MGEVLRHHDIKAANQTNEHTRALANSQQKDGGCFRGAVGLSNCFRSQKRLRGVKAASPGGVVAPEAVLGIVPLIFCPDPARR